MLSCVCSLIGAILVFLILVVSVEILVMDTPTPWSI